MSIDHTLIEGLSALGEPSGAEFSALLRKASLAKGLALDEAASLLAVSAPARLAELYAAALSVKERVFGKRVVLFAPLYLSNYCTNGCLYCGFRASVREMPRKALTVDEAVSEARLLSGMGFKRVLLVVGEDPRWGLEYLADCVRAIYERSGMRIVHVNAPPMDTASLKELKAAGAGVYQAFQETYHRPTYERMHPAGRKKDFPFRLSVMDRAMEAGFGDVGIGPLLGLYDYRYDALASIAHSNHLYSKYGAHAHTISIPRLRPAASGLKEVPYRVTDGDLKKIVAVFRLAVPSAGIVASTREGAALRAELISVGATQLSAASKTGPGGYGSSEEVLEQFSTNDHRGLNEVMRSVVASGMLPSLCTTCYRVGRTGEDFTSRSLAGEMGRFCQANAVLTLKEYLLEQCLNGTRDAMEKALREAVDSMEDAALKKAVEERLARIEAGERDLYF